MEFAGLKEDEILKRKAEVLDEACSKCSKYWEGKSIDSFPVRVKGLKSLGGQSNDHEVLKTMANSSSRKLKGDPQLTTCRSEYQFFVRHLTRKTYQIEFVKCTRLDCGHCSKQGIQAVNFFGFLKEHGGMVPIPQPSKMNPNVDFKEYLPSLKGKPQDSCRESTCRYIFNSKADEKRHNLLMNHKKK